MHIELARPSDAEAIRQICDELDLVVDVATELARSFSQVWVARPHPVEAPVAFLVAWEVAGELHIQDVATEPRARRRGAARALVGRALGYARDRKNRIALLEVREHNHAARRLYESAGFVVLRERARYYADGEDALEMGCELAAGGETAFSEPLSAPEAP